MTESAESLKSLAAKKGEEGLREKERRRRSERERKRLNQKRERKIVAQVKKKPCENNVGIRNLTPKDILGLVRINIFKNYKKSCFWRKKIKSIKNHLRGRKKIFCRALNL